jgi:hypothetical protein
MVFLCSPTAEWMYNHPSPDPNQTVGYLVDAFDLISFVAKNKDRRLDKVSFRKNQIRAAKIKHYYQVDAENLTKTFSNEDVIHVP